MKKKNLLVALAIIVVLATAFFVYSITNPDRTVSVSVEQTIVQEELSFGFSYPSGEDALSLIESPVSEEGALQQAYLLFPTSEYISFQQSEEASEAPAAISIFVFEEGESDDPDAGRITRLQNWASKNSVLTSYDMALNTPDILELDGVRSIRYEATGLYSQEVYLASYRGNIYMFVGQYVEEGDYLDVTFEEVISSVAFY